MTPTEKGASATGQVWRLTTWLTGERDGFDYRYGSQESAERNGEMFQQTGGAARWEVADPAGQVVRSWWSGENAGARFDTTIEAYQVLAGGWTDSRFPDDDLKQRGLVLGEETGEVLRCILKAEQGIRGGREKWLAELPAETADVFFCLAALAHRAGFNLSDAIFARWEELNQRTYTSEREAR
ncbi:MAG TPA: MazG-like family protein [Mycobacterium sp.]|nr:MazG-like family protein [Mycobacterium sp.]